MSIARLDERLDRIRSRISEHQALLAREPDDLAAQLYLASAFQEEEEVTGLLRQARKERWKEARIPTTCSMMLFKLKWSYSYALLVGSNIRPLEMNMSGVSSPITCPNSPTRELNFEPAQPLSCHTRSLTSEYRAILKSFRR